MLDAQKNETQQPSAEPARKVVWVVEEYDEVVDLLVLPEGQTPPGPEWKRRKD